MKDLWARSGSHQLHSTAHGHRVRGVAFQSRKQIGGGAAEHGRGRRQRQEMTVLQGHRVADSCVELSLLPGRHLSGRPPSASATLQFGDVISPRAPSRPVASTEHWMTDCRSLWCESPTVLKDHLLQNITVNLKWH